tara:strand:+ start:371 stop:556 length:186 start_codon:yes stop_codon:yes gene_type:complete
MKTILTIIVAGLLLSACSKTVTFGKKCVEKEGQVLWSYVWITDKPMVVDKHFCKNLTKKVK